MYVFYLIFLSYLPSSWSSPYGSSSVQSFNSQTCPTAGYICKSLSQLLIASYRPLVLTVDATQKLESGPVLLLSLPGLNMVAWSSLGAIMSDNVGGSRFWQVHPHFKRWGEAHFRLNQILQDKQLKNRDICARDQN